jgi:hypothetical protein
MHTTVLYYNFIEEWLMNMRWQTETIGVKLRPKQSAVYRGYTCQGTSKRNDASNRRLRKMAGIGFLSVVANCAQMCTAVTQYLDCGLPRRKWWYRGLPQFKVKFESGLLRGYSCCGKPQRTWERFAKGSFLLCQTEVLECGFPQQSKIPYQPFYIDSPPVRGAVSFDARLNKCKTYGYTADCLGLN